MAANGPEAKTFGKTYSVGHDLPKAKNLEWKPQKKYS
jgi:hypothetical protein